MRFTPGAVAFFSLKTWWNPSRWLGCWLDSTGGGNMDSEELEIFIDAVLD